MKPRRALWSGLVAGLVAGTATVALMYLCAAVLGLRPLPQLLNQPILSVMPGFVFGFLIDTLQHAGKVVEEVGLIVAMIAGLGVLGAAWAWTRERRPLPYLALGFAAIAWLVVVAVLLPVAGLGMLGLVDGPATPIIWAALFAVYGTLLQAMDPVVTDEASADPGRRRMLRLLPVGVGALSLGAIALELLPGWYRAIFMPPEAGLVGAVPELTPIGNFYMVSKNFSDPVVSEAGWTLKIGGLVDQPRQLSLSDLRRLAATTQFTTLECISNNVGGELMSTGSFKGVPLRDLVQSAAPKPNGSWVAMKARDGYIESLPWNLINGAPEILVAYELDGAPLPNSHGFPARMLIPGHYGMKGPKWLDAIEMVDREAAGYWEQQGWDHDASVKTTARLDVPRDGDIVQVGAVALAGVAFSGTRGISRVEYSTDGGSHWTDATIKAPLSPLTWVLWQASWTPSHEGSFRLVVRATDGAGSRQPTSVAPSYPSGASGYHSIRVDVSR